VITNGAQLLGKIAVIDRGLCNFTVKVKNAQNAGAVGCLLVNNVAGGFSPSGTDATITIPVLALSQADGTSLKTAISGGPTTVTMRLSPTQIAGLSPTGHVRMYAPNPFQSGSSVSHFDVSCTPNLLMEPAINPDLTSDIDLTDPVFRDIGWLPRVLDVPGGGPAARVALANKPNPAWEPPTSSSASSRTSGSSCRSTTSPAARCARSPRARSAPARTPCTGTASTRTATRWRRASTWRA